MKLKDMGFFILAVLIGLLFAIYRWGDSGHAIGLISSKGGKVRHPALMKSGKSHYCTITTLTVMPPFSGDVQIVLEGSPPLDYEIHLPRPFIDLGICRLPELRDNILCGVESGDRLALWTIIKPKKNNSAGVSKKSKSDFSVNGKYSLAFYDRTTGKSVLKVPLIFEGQETKYARRPH